MKKIAAAFFLAIFAAGLSLLPAKAADDAFLGHWRQINSTGGKCADCKISISRRDSRLLVRASNGWQVVAQWASDGKREILVGAGNWPISATSARKIAADFSIQGGKLILVMQFFEPNGRYRRVQATFERAQNGSAI